MNYRDIDLKDLYKCANNIVKYPDRCGYDAHTKATREHFITLFRRNKDRIKSSSKLSLIKEAEIILKGEAI